MKHIVRIVARENKGAWRGVLEMREQGSMNGTMPLFRKLMENEKDNHTEALADAMLYYGRHVEKVLKALGIGAVVQIDTQEHKE